MSYSTNGGFQVMYLKKNETPLSGYSVSLRDSILVPPECYLEALEIRQDKFATQTVK
jgi:hypothetical protein